MKKPTSKILCQLAIEHAGVLTDIAKATGVCRQTVDTWKNKDPKFKEAIQRGTVTLVDLAVTGLKHHLKEKSEKSIHYTLDRLARDKGFGRLIQIADKSKFEDQFNDKTDDELMEILQKTNEKLEKG